MNERINTINVNSIVDCNLSSTIGSMSLHIDMNDTINVLITTITNRIIDKNVVNCFICSSCLELSLLMLINKKLRISMAMLIGHTYLLEHFPLLNVVFFSEFNVVYYQYSEE